MNVPAIGTETATIRPTTSHGWLNWSLTTAALSCAAAWLAPYLFPDWSYRAQACFLLYAAAIAAFMGGLGMRAQRSFWSIFLSGRNTYSLSKLQMVLWTILVLGALMAAATMRYRAGQSPLDVRIPTDLLAAMGISLVSAAATPALLSVKSRVEPSLDEILSAETKVGGPIVPNGRVFARPQFAKPSLLDLVTGDDLANAGRVDLSKVQQLLVTAIIVVVYAGLVMNQLASEPFTAAVTELHGFDRSLVDLMLVSHGGYLAYKAVPKPAADGTAPLDRPVPPDRLAESSL